MSFKRSFSLKFLIGSGFVLAVVPLFLALVWMSFSVRETSTLNKQTSIQIFEQTRTLSQVLQKAADVERKARLFLLLSAPDIKQPYERESYEAARSAFHLALSSLLAMKLDSNIALVAHELGEKETLIYQRLTGNTPPNGPDASMDTAFQGLRDSATALSTALQSRVDQAFKALRQQSDTLQTTLLATGTALMIFAGLIALWLTRATSQSLRTLDAAIDCFALDELARQAIADAPADIREIAAHMDELREHVIAVTAAKHRFMMQLAEDLTPVLARLDKTLDELARHELIRLDADLATIAQTLKTYDQTLDTSVDTLMRLAQLEREPQEPIRSVNVQDLVLRIINEVQPRLKTKSIHLVTALSPLMLPGWETPLHDMMLELLVNAIDHSPTHGEIRILLQADDGHLLLEVEDQGPGIPYQHRNWVFQPFFRYPLTADSDRNRHGIGLAMVKHHAHCHGGTVELGDSKPETQGTLIRVRLPLPSEMTA